MRSWAAPVVAVLSVVGLMVGLALASSRPTASSPDPSADAADPSPPPRETVCATPLGWRLAAVDPRFGVPRDEVEGAVEAAVRIWNEGAQRLLLTPDPEDGVAIRLVRDSRQDRLTDSQRMSQDLERQERALADGHRELAALQAVHEGEIRMLEQASAVYTSERDLHNTEVRRWNDEGGAPDSMVHALRTREESLRTEAVRLDSVRWRLEERAAVMAASVEALRREAEAFERRRGEAEARFPPTEVEAAVYREWSLGGAGEQGRVGREIRVFRFAHRNDLVLILAHEFGHALGLPHLTTPGAVMNEQGGLGGWDGDPTLHADDLALLQSLCPEA